MTEQNQTPDTADAEGHHFRDDAHKDDPFRRTDDDVEGHYRYRGDDDVEGHQRRKGDDDSDDTEGHQRRKGDDEDDAQGHRMR